MLDVINEVLERHAAGIEFREENAGFYFRQKFKSGVIELVKQLILKHTSGSY